MIRAYHFVGKTLRDGSPVPKDGNWLEVKGPLKMCQHGLHWSRQPFDALQYAPGPILCLVDASGEIIEEMDKGCSTRRRIVARFDATKLLGYFARMQALSVIHVWEPTEVVLDYLMTGESTIKEAARAAAEVAARAAARAAARYAAWDAAWAAASAAANAAEWAVAWDVAKAAAWAAARADFNALVYESFERLA